MEIYSFDLMIADHFGNIKFTRYSMPEGDDHGPVSMDLTVPKEIMADYRKLSGKQEIDWHEFWDDIRKPLSMHFDAHQARGAGDANGYVLSELARAEKFKVEAGVGEDRVELTIDEIL